MTTFMDMMDVEVRQQLEVVPVNFALNQQSPSWLTRSKVLTAGFCDMVQNYLRDLASCISVKQRSIPEQPTVLAGTEVAVHYLPVMGVSGDYYDVVPLGEKQVGLAIGDACGKGMAAAPLMASVCFNLWTQARSCHVAAGELLARLNRAIYRDTPMHLFMTLAYGVWDSGNHTFTYSRAGHPPVLHYQVETGRVHELDVGGTILGVCEAIEYPTESVYLGLGDALVLYTDGIIEASNARDETFGVNRLSEVVAAYGSESSEELASAILGAASQFAGRGWEDDVTLMVVKRTDE